VSPTYEVLASFQRGYARLTPSDRARFRKAVDLLVEDLQADRLPRPGLRVKRVQGAAGIWELTWAPDGRATFERGAEVKPGEPHIVWRRIGTHEIFGRP
jgi:hypothetical protein